MLNGFDETKHISPDSSFLTFNDCEMPQVNDIHSNGKGDHVYQTLDFADLMTQRARATAAVIVTFFRYFPASSPWG